MNYRHFGAERAVPENSLRTETRPTATPSRRSGSRLLLLGASTLLLACNLITGVGDLDFDRVGAALAPCDPASNTGCASGETCVGDATTSTLRCELSPACDPITSMGCAPGQVCMPSAATGRAECSEPPPVPVGPYAPCTQTAQCPEAHECLNNLCRKTCTSDADCGWGGAVCAAVAGSELSACSRSCDLVSPGAPRPGLQACGGDAQCVFVTVEGDGYTDCVVAGGSFRDGPCSGHSECPAGLLCSGGRCSEACDPNQLSPCRIGTTCSRYGTFAEQDIGRCCTVPSGAECNISDDCGCTSGETCGSNGSQPACRLVPEVPVALYAACTGVEQCPARSGCFLGSCHPLCNDDTDCSEESECLPGYNTTSGEPTGAAYCSRDCDPSEAQAPREGFEACGAGLSCRFIAGNDNSLRTCAEPGPREQGTACTDSAQCVQGLACVDGLCLAFCALDASACGGGMFCRELPRRAEHNLGYCCEAPPAGQDCQWVTDCGCAPDESCALDSTLSAFCRTLAPSSEIVGPYEACAGNQDCPAHYTCSGNVCAQNCLAPTDCDSAGVACNLVSEGTPFGSCSRNCDVFSPTAPAPGFEPCGAGLTCANFFDNDNGGIPYFACIAPGALAEGETCSATSDCVAGLKCEDEICMRYCTVGTDSCPNGATCIQQNTPVIAGRIVGLCSPAAGTGG